MRFMQRNIFKNTEIKKTYEKHDLDEPEASQVIRGGCGPGANTYLYTVSAKKPNLQRFESPRDELAQNPA